MSGNSYDLTMMRAKKSSKRLTTMVGIALLVVLFGAFPGYAAKNPTGGDDSVTTDEDTSHTFAEGDFTFNDEDGDTFAGIKIATVETAGALQYDGTDVVVDTECPDVTPLVFTPAADANGAPYATFTFNVKDSTSAYSTSAYTMTITVTPVNDPPVAVNDTYSIDEDQTLTMAAPGVLGNDSDVDGDSLSAVLGSNVSNGTLTLAADGSFSYTPSANFNGSDSFTYKANDGTADSNVATVTLTVNAVNDAPVANDQSVTTDEDTAVDITLTASDVEDGVPQFTSHTDPAHGTLSGTMPNLTYTPAVNYCGPDSFTFLVTDSDAATDTGTVSINVTCVNDPPVANDDSDTTPEDTPVSTNVVANDTDVDGTVVASAVAIVSGPRNGSVVNNGNGTVTYTPNANFNGSDSFTYTVKDNGGATSNVATVTINVGVVNDAPVANDDSDTTPEDTPVSTNVVANDTDVDGTVVASTVAIVSGPRNGSVVNNGNGTVTYTPNENFNGSDSFTYTVKDNGGATSNVAIVTINVGAVNDPPVAQMDSEITDESVPVTIPVLANDSDPDGDRLTVESVTQPSNGTVTNNGTDVTYSPNPDFNGMGTFTYTVADGNGGTDTTTVMVAVAVVNDPPVAQEDSAITDEDMPVTIPVLANDSDPDGDRLTVESVTQPSNGTVTNNGTDVTYSPDPDFDGSDSFTYTVSDKNGGTDTARVSVEVLEGAADGEGGAYGPSEGKVKLGELVSQVRFVKRDTDNISWLVPGVPNLTVLEDSMVLEKLALSTDLEPTRYRAGAHLDVGVELPTMEERRAHGWPWIRVTSPDLAEPGNVTAGFSFSGRSADGIYWFGIDIGDVPWGRYDFWIVYGEEKMILVPIIVSP